MGGRRAILSRIASDSELNIESRMTMITRIYGISLTDRETGQIASRLRSDFESGQRNRRLEQMEDAILSFLRESNPQLANRAAAIIEGSRLWSELNIENAPVPVPSSRRSRQSTVGDIVYEEIPQSFGQALRECQALEGREKLERFQEIVIALAEAMRVRQGEGEEMENLLGQRYDIFASDVRDLYGQDRLNCFSGSIALGLLVEYAAREAGLEDEVDTRIRQVASVNMGGGRWDDTGHGLLEVRFGDNRLFFDSTNAALDWQGTRFEYIAERNYLHTTRGHRVRYYLGASFPVDGNMISTARLQDRLLQTRGELSDSMVRSVSRLPPVFLSYFINRIGAERRAEFFRQMGVRGMRGISHPSERFRLATMASMIFRNTEPDLARSFGTLALRSLEEAASDERYLAALPMGRFLNDVVMLADMMGRSRRGAELVRRSRIWTYIPVVATRAATTIEPATARTALNFMTNFMEQNGQLISAQTPLVHFSILRGMVHLQRLAGPSVRGNADSRGRIRELYGMLGIDMDAALTRLAEIAGLTIPRDRSGNTDLGQLYALNETARQLEEQFLRTIYQVLDGNFSLQDMRIARARVSPQGRVAVDAIIALYDQNLESVMMSGGNFRRAAEQLGLV